ncbi:hypothetical protein [Alkaliphilus pronyensis]|nr:hypothetical protein [Alkaliphilus pronyensis]
MYIWHLVAETGYGPVKSYDFEYYDKRFNPGDEESELDIYTPIS